MLHLQMLIPANPCVSLAEDAKTAAVSEQKPTGAHDESGDAPAGTAEPEAELNGEAAVKAAQEAAAAAKKRVFRGIAQAPALLQDLRRCARQSSTLH